MAQTPLFSKRMSIVVDGSTIGMASDYDLSVEKDMIDIVYLNSTGWKTAVPDLKGWRVSFSGFVTLTTSRGAQLDGDVLMQKLINSDASVLVKLLPADSSQVYYQGGGYLKSLSQKGGAGQPVTFSGEIQGIEGLTISTT